MSEAQRRDALQPGHRHRRPDADGDGLFQCVELNRSGRATRYRPRHHQPFRTLDPTDGGVLAASACPAILRIPANTARARSALMSCAPTCSSTTISLTSSTTPSMAISSTNSTAARLAGSMRDTPLIGALATLRRKLAQHGKPHPERHQRDMRRRQLKWYRQIRCR